MARREIWAADCETDPFKVGRPPKPFIWGAYEIYTRRYVCFSSKELFVAFFREKKCTVYFHNGGKFDSHFLREFFNSDQEIKIINGRIAVFKIGEAEFRDSYNIIPVPLARYSKEKIDYAIMEVEVRDLPENVIKIELYLKSDCVNLGTLLLAYFERYGKGLTQAGTAMNYWAKHYNGGKKPKQTPAQYERYKPYYYGGRVECFVSGYAEKRFKVVDLNAAYGNAMRSQHPICPEGIRMSKLPEDSKLPQCMVSLRAVSRGAFPYRLKTGELIFPRDNVSRVYDITGWELQTAMELNAVNIQEILDVHYFRETITFKDYIEYFYNERKLAKTSGDKAGDIFCKGFINGSYGRFAMNPEHYHEYMLSSKNRMDEHVGNGYRDYQDWGDGRRLLWRNLSIEKQRDLYCNIATAESITGFVRANYYRDLVKVIEPIYGDTDSIMAVDVSGLNLGNELGQWKVELECDAYAILGKKFYAVRSAFDQHWSDEDKQFTYPKGAWKVASKGVRLTADQIVALAKGEMPEFKYEPMVPTYTIIRPQPRFTNRRVRVTAKVQLGSLLQS